MISLPVILIVSIVIGALLSNLVLSLSPLAEFAVIFGVSAVIIAAVELSAYFRRKPRNPGDHYQSVYRTERKRRARRLRRSGKTHSPAEEEVIDQELAAPVEPY